MCEGAPLYSGVSATVATGSIVHMEVCGGYLGVRAYSTVTLNEALRLIEEDGHLHPL
jgi:hypothetical protein